MGQQAKQRWSRLSIGCGGALAVLLVSIGLGLLYSFISGNPASPGMFGAPAGIGLLILWRAAFAADKELFPPPLPESQLDDLNSALQEAGLGKVKLRYAAEGDMASFPRPHAYGPMTIISKRILDEWSPDALKWSVKVDSAASKAFVRKFGITFFLVALGAISFLGLAERYKLASVYVVFAFLFVPALLIGASFYGYRLQLIEDRRFTKSEHDRRAAKEALSYPFFAQADRPRWNKWLFSRAELRGRAKHLGIELERGFRAP